jgi:hypothetical protein
VLLRDRAKGTARSVIHLDLYKERMRGALHVRHPPSVLVNYAGMVLERAFVESTKRGFMLDESKDDVLPAETTSAARHATERKTTNPDSRQIIAVHRCRLRGCGTMYAIVDEMLLGKSKGKTGDILFESESKVLPEKTMSLISVRREGRCKLSFAARQLVEKVVSVAAGIEIECKRAAVLGVRQPIDQVL